MDDVSDVHHHMFYQETLQIDSACCYTYNGRYVHARAQQQHNGGSSGGAPEHSHADRMMLAIAIRLKHRWKLDRITHDGSCGWLTGSRHLSPRWRRLAEA